MRSSLCLLLAAVTCLPGAPVRVKELVTLEGVRENQLIGYGLVVGLAGTGDKRQTVFSAQTLANVLDRMGVQVNPNALLVRNTAAVLVTANLPPFAQPGTRLDVTVAAIGDSANLQGGLLVMTPLKGADGQTYAVAQGSVVTGGFSAGRGGSSTMLNHPTAGRIMNGALIERNSPSQLSATSLRLQLRRADFTTASSLAQAVNRKFGPGTARPENSALVSIQVPEPYKDRVVDLIAGVEALTLDVDRTARIVVQERTGTIVMGKEVRIRPVAIMHGGLNIEIQTRLEVSQPNALSKGETATTPQTTVAVKEEKARSLTLKEGATVEDLARALISVGSTPRDIIAILQNLQSAGALDAEIEVL
jgi:flagellar P-ring protein FlgI